MRISDWSSDVCSSDLAATIENGRPRMVYFDEASVAAQEHCQLSAKFPGQYVTYVNHTADGNVSLLYVHSDRDPGAWYLFDRAPATIKLPLAARAGIDPARMADRRYISSEEHTSEP